MRTINFFKRPKNLALLSLVVVFMALIRIVVECLRLQTSQTLPGPLPGIKPFLYAALITAIVGFALALLTHYQKYFPMIVLAVINTALLVAIKIIYHL